MKKKNAWIGKTIALTFLTAVAAIMILPLLWTVTSSLKSSDSIFSIPPEWIPKEFHWENYLTAFEQISFARALFNSLVIAVLSTIGQVISSVLVAYGLARLDFPGKKVWFYLFIGSMMLPSVIGLLPLFSIYKSLGWYNTWLPLIFPNFFGAPFYIFMLRQFLMQVPRTYDEAATMDGAGHLFIIRKILLPMLKPVIVIVIIMQLQGSWNDYLTPLVYLTKVPLWTASLAVAQFLTNATISWNIFMAAAVVYLLPMLVVFFLGQKYFMSGYGSLNGSGIKQ